MRERLAHLSVSFWILSNFLMNALMALIVFGRDFIIYRSFPL